MNKLTPAPFLRSTARQCCILTRPQHRTAVAATYANLPRMTPDQLQYGKPNKPSPPSTHKRLDQIHANIPTYPHPRKYWYKKANLGLYGNVSLRAGHTISSKNEHKNKRIWRPNVQQKRLWSECLGRWVRVKIVMRVLRTIDKVGGLDNYLLGSRKGRIKELGMAGWALRWRVLRTEKGRERAMRERKELGLEGEPRWMALPFASKWLAAQEAKRALANGDVLGVEIVRPMESDAAAAEVVASAATDADEAAAQELERMIDEEFDADDEAAARGEEGGIEFSSESEAEVEKQKDRV